MEKDGFYEAMIPALPRGHEIPADSVHYKLNYYFLIDLKLSALMSPLHVCFFTTIPLSSSAKDRFPLRFIFAVPECRKSCSHLMMPFWQSLPKNSSVSYPNSFILTCFCCVLLDQISLISSWGLLPPPTCFLYFFILINHTKLFTSQYCSIAYFFFSKHTSLIFPIVLHRSVSFTDITIPWSNSCCLGQSLFSLSTRLSLLLPDSGHLRVHNLWKNFSQHKSENCTVSIVPWILLNNNNYKSYKSFIQ